MSLRVLHVIPSVSLSQGGPSFAIRSMEAALSRRGVHVTTLTTDDDGSGRRSNAPPDLREGAHRVMFPKRTEFYKFAPGMIPWLWRNVSSFDVVHIHAMFSFSSAAASWIARARRVPYVIRPLGTLTAYGLGRRRPLLKRIALKLVDGPALRHAAAVQFTSESERTEAAAVRVAMRSAVISLGVPRPANPRPRLVRDTFPELGDAPFVLYLSRLDPKKNLETLLRAFATLLESGCKARLLVAGAGAPAYEAALKDLARSLSLHEAVVWAGAIAGELKQSALHEAAVFALPSFSENFGIAVAEALGAGAPCVVSHGVAVSREVVAHGAGLAVAPEPAPVAAALRQLLGDDRLRAEMSRNALQLAESEYSLETMGSRLIELYESVRAAPGKVTP